MTPVAIRSGDVMGFRVHVLDDGQHIIDADDFEALLVRLEADPTFDVQAFARAMGAFLHGGDGGAQ